MPRAQERYNRLIRRATIPMAAVVAVLLCVLLGTLLAVASYQNDAARGEQKRFTEGALRGRERYLASNVSNYSAWNETFEHLANGVDVEWAAANLVPGLSYSLGVELALVAAPDGRIVFAVRDGVAVPVPRDVAMSRALNELLARHWDEPTNVATTGLVLVDGKPAVAAVGAIRRTADNQSPTLPEPHRALVIMDLVNEAMLGEIAETFHLEDLRLVPDASSDDTMVPLVAEDGTKAGLLSWNGSRPGDALLRVALPVWAALVMVAVALTMVILRQVRSATRLIMESEWRARHDLLTDLPNRVHFLEQLETQTLAMERGAPGFVLAYLDLDGFKAVNDTHGHVAGDMVLREVAARLRKCLHADDFVARLGGDEFAMILANRRNTGEIRNIGNRVIERIEHPIAIEGGVSVAISATIGAALAPSQGSTPAALLHNADQTLYLGKRNGRRQVRIFEAAPGMPVAG